jgi:hypothetical protein
MGDQISGSGRTATCDQRSGGKKKAYAEGAESTENRKARVKRGGVEALGRKSPPFPPEAGEGLIA